MSALQLTPAQAVALRDMLAFASTPGVGLFTLEGYAGVGKTTVVAEMLRSMPQHLRVAVAAPTNKAVGVLQAKIGEQVGNNVEFGSLHSFLGLRLIEREDGTTWCRPEGRCRVNEFDLIIIDEASMVGGDLFQRLVMAQHSSRTLFVGDPAQLPPVAEKGRVRETASPAFTRVQRKAALTEVVRQQRDNPIIALSMTIRGAIEAGRRIDAADLAQAFPPDARNVCLTYGGTRAAIDWALHDLREGRDSRILAYRNVTVVCMNQAIHEALHGNAFPFAPGERVMLNQAFKAETGAQLFNSEELTCVDICHDTHPEYPDIRACRITLERSDGVRIPLWVAFDPEGFKRHIDALWQMYHRLKANGKALHAAEQSAKNWTLARTFAPLRHVYAMTVHKSQGSTLHTAIVHLGDIACMPDPGEHARALYVAVTRPMHNLGLVTP